MQTKLLNDVVSEIVGKQASGIVELLMGKKDVNEFLIAKKLKLTINQVRNILYKLANFNLVTFTRRKDRRKGWYTYFWTLDIEKALEQMSKKLEKETENLKNQFRNRASKRFYMCNTCKVEVSEEMALLNNFVCQECGEVYKLADNKKTISELEKNIYRLERQKESIFEELRKIEEIKLKEREKEERKKARKKIRKSKKKAKKKKKIKRKVKKRKRRRKIKLRKSTRIKKIKKKVGKKQRKKKK